MSTDAPRQGWLAGAMVYLRRDMAALAALGFVSGLPLAIKGQALQARLSDSGLRVSEIGLFSLAGLPYVLKFLWAPLLDWVPPPGPLAKLGRRRGWLVAIQLSLILVVAAMGWVEPRETPLLMAGFALAIAFLGASQDIVIDALRIEHFGEDEQAAGLALFVAAYRIALLVAVAGTLAGVQGLELLGLDRDVAWGLAYGMLAGLLALGLIATFAIGPERGAVAIKRETSWRRAVIEPFRAILGRRGIVMILLFVVTFKLGDAMADMMFLPFALSIGYSKATYAWAASAIGLTATLAGGFLAGIVERAIGPWPTLWVGALVQALPNFALTWLALRGGTDAWALALANGINNLGHGFGSVVFVAFLSRLCTERAITATHYALLSALAATSRTVLVGPSGFLAEAMGWPGFFAFTVLACGPGIFLLWWLDRDRRRAV